MSVRFAAACFRCPERFAKNNPITKSALNNWKRNTGCWQSQSGLVFNIKRLCQPSWGTNTTRHRWHKLHYGINPSWRVNAVQQLRSNHTVSYYMTELLPLMLRAEWLISRCFAQYFKYSILKSSPNILQNRRGRRQQRTRMQFCTS